MSLKSISALVVLYLLSLSWVTVVLSLPWVNRLSDAPRLVNIFSIVQSYAFIAFALVVLVTAHTFGGTPDCNPTAKVVLFRPFQFFEAGRILAWILISSILFAYTVLTIMDYMPPKQKQKLYELRKIRIRRLRPSSEDKSDLPQHINPNTGLPEPALNKNAPKMTDPASMLPHLLRHVCIHIVNGKNLLTEIIPRKRTYIMSVSRDGLYSLCLLLEFYGLSRS